MKKEEKIHGWMERLLLPKLNESTGEIKALHTRLDSVEKEIASLRSETKTEIASFLLITVHVQFKPQRSFSSS
jgi:tetrahydromethanopterin S-methyltransferase subunit G